MKRIKHSDESPDQPNDQDTMRAEYDFSHGVRGVTAARYGQGANVIVIDPEVRDVFPDSAAVNDALRALAPLIRGRQQQQPTVRRLRRSSQTATE